MTEKSLIDEVFDVSEDPWVASIVCNPQGTNRVQDAINLFFS